MPSKFDSPASDVIEPRRKYAPGIGVEHSHDLAGDLQPSPIARIHELILRGSVASRKHDPPMINL
jgi:hypothetical protein